MSNLVQVLKHEIGPEETWLLIELCAFLVLVPCLLLLLKVRERWLNRSIHRLALTLKPFIQAPWKGCVLTAGVTLFFCIFLAVLNFPLPRGTR